MRKFFGIMLLLLVMVIAGCSSDEKAGGEASFPSDNIEIIAPATPGGGWDATARSMQKVFSDNGIIEENMNVVNKPGGGGEVGWQYLKKQDAHHIAINSSLVITNNILGQSELTHKDFTPLAILTTEWNAVTVAPDSKFETGAEIMEQLKKDPTSLKIAVAPSLGNDDHLSFVQAAQEFGVDVTKLQFMIYESGGDVLTAMLGGHVDVATSSVSEFKEQHLAGKVKMVAVTSEKPIKGLEDIPTWKEQGVDMVFPHWRGVMGPPDMTEEEIAYWDDKIGKLVETDAWKEILKNNEWESYYMDSTETKKFLEEQTKKYEELLNVSGLTE
ncbi:tripartite tricarboxylate transporter substrate binding protein [Virgibacillus ndiopensis]|uniref:tripartite tricarboxylate transporter substrate binding protein n=1 Tax=Virgibacillus ndiopensis TaxID=2004408 RepID=UPI000C077296|nr:tripartite tricarboxylate transporter substrate binding protein [Virgibacillus ndiopensis]